MGNCFSDPSKPAPLKGGQRLGSGPANPPSAVGSGSRPAGPTSPKAQATPQKLGSGSGGESPGGAGGSPREAMLAAAEARAKAAASKGVSSANPKAGVLSAKLDAQPRGTGAAAAGAQNERLMDAGQWN